MNQFIAAICNKLKIGLLATFFCMLAIPGTLFAATINVSSLSALQTAINNANPGDIIILANGVYTASSDIMINKQGTASQPITIQAATILGAEIRGTAGFALNSPARYIIIKGFKFTHNASQATTASGTSFCRWTRNLFQTPGDGEYLTLNGNDHQVDYNTFQHKNGLGRFMTIRGTGSQISQRHWIHHNYFWDQTPAGANGGESVQFGLSGYSLSNTNSIMEHNLFEECEGENEMVSLKVSQVTFRYNTIRNCPAHLTLRHGNRNIIYGNCFINTPGIRYFGDDHKIFSNHFENCDPAINIGNGGGEVADGDPLTSHDRPDRVFVGFNTLVNNPRNFIMQGRTGGLGAIDNVIANNIIQGGGSAVALSGSFAGGSYSGNILYQTSGAGNMPSGGYTTVNPLLARDATGTFHLQSGSPAINAATGSHPSVTFDMDGQARTAPLDKGADEVSSATVNARILTTSMVGPNASTDPVNIPPTVSITAPSNGASFPVPATVTINANAADADGTVSQVEFFQGSFSLGVVNTPPFTLDWTHPTAGAYVLTARATDNDNATSTSAPVNITITAPPGCPAVIASADDGNVPANVLDDNLATRWSASGDGQWIQFCLTDPVSVTGVQIAFYSGDTRTSTFDVLVGNDGNTWTTASASRVSGGTSLALETFSFTPVTGKYVRIVGHGNSVNLWNSYTEVKINTGTGGGQTYTLTPEHDAYVRDGANAAITHGTTDPTLLITKVSPSGQLNNAREAYLLFNLASVSGTVNTATLRVYGKIDGTTVTSVPIGIFPVANLTWTESTITWNNKPASGGTALGTSNVTNAAFAYITWNVTSYVQAQLAAGKVSFAMKSGAAHDPRVFWNSKEFGSNPPQLVIQTSTSFNSQEQPQQTLTVEREAAPVKFNAYPNPFKISNNIDFHLAKAGHTNLTVFDISGKQVAVLVNGYLSAGNHRAVFTPAVKAPGIYLVRIAHDGRSVTKRIVKE